MSVPFDKHDVRLAGPAHQAFNQIADLVPDQFGAGCALYPTA